MVDLSTFYFDKNRTPISPSFSLVGRCKDITSGNECQHSHRHKKEELDLVPYKEVQPVDYLAKLKAIEFINSFDLDKINSQFYYSLYDELNDILFQYDIHIEGLDYCTLFDYFDNISEDDLLDSDIDKYSFFNKLQFHLQSIMSSIDTWLKMPLIYLFLPNCNVCGSINRPPIRYSIYQRFFDHFLDMVDHSYIFFKSCHIIIFYENSPVTFKTVAESQTIFPFPKDTLVSKFPDAPFILYMPIAGVLPVLPDDELYSDFDRIPTIRTLFPNYIGKLRLLKSHLNPLYHNKNKFFSLDDFSRLIPPDFSFKEESYPRIMEDDDPLLQNKPLKWKDCIYIKTSERHSYFVEYEKFCLFCHYPRSEFEGTVCPHCNNDFGPILEKYAQKTDQD